MDILGLRLTTNIYKTLRPQNIIKVLYSSKSDPPPPKNVLENLVSAQHQSENGIVYDKKPIKIALDAGKNYSWCLCGRSNTQPFCDGSHKIAQYKIKQKPVRFQVAESKEYWLCNCKHTRNRPFCDGMHKTPAIQEATSRIRN